jgi:hypothetical protein
MTMLPNNEKRIDDFFNAIEPFQVAYRYISFSYIAVRHGDDFQLLQGKILFNTEPFKKDFLHFHSDNIRAGQYHLSELKLEPRGLIAGLLSGELSTPHGRLLISGNDDGKFSTSYDPTNQDGIKAQARYNALTIYGASQTSNIGQSILEAIRQPLLNWELRAASTPYDNLQELAFENVLGPITGNVNVEALAFNVAYIDFSSKVSGTLAKPAVFLAHGLSPENVTLGYRVFNQGRAETRARIQGSEMQWTQLDSKQHGVAEINVPNAAALHCFVSYSGIAQQFGWIADPAAVQNPKRAVYNIFDNNLEILKDFLSKAAGKGRDARDLETGVAWLLWMLGFSVAHLGATDKTQDAADLIVTTPTGHFAVVECTTGLLKADNKLPLLVERAARVRRGVDASNNKHLRVLPVIVTSRTRDEIKADIEQAEKRGILVLSRENLDQAVNNTLVFPNAEQLYEQALQEVESAIEKYNSPVALESG